MPPGQIRVQNIENAGPGVLGQGDDGGKVRVRRFAKAGVAIAEKPEAPAKIHRPLVVIFQPLPGKQAGGRIHRRVLHLPVKGPLPLADQHTHQVVVGALFGPEHLRPRQHLLLMPQKKPLRRLFPPGIGKVGIARPPDLPEGAFGKLLHGPQAKALVGRVAQKLHQQAVVVEDRSDADDIGIAVAGLAHRAEKPPLHPAPPLRGEDLQIVFNVVQHDQVGPSGPVPPAAKLLAGADGVDARSVFQKDHRAFPDLAPHIAEIPQNGLVFLQLRLDGV